MARLQRSKDCVFGGVCAGVAEYFGWDVRTLRLVWLVLAIVGVGSSVLFYLILWIVMPVGNGKSYEERMNERLNKK